MSVQALSWVLDDVRGLKAPERIVLIVLANYADKDNASCWPAIGTIAGCCELTPETVRRTLRKLETKGLVASEQTYRKNGAKSTNLYRLRIEAGAPPAGQGVHPTPDEGRRGAPDEGNHPLPQGGSTTLNRQSNHQPKQNGADFETFWKAYPKKVGKRAALRAFKALGAERPPVAELVEALERHKKAAGWLVERGKFIPHPTTWLNQGRWEDELMPDAPSAEEKRLAGIDPSMVNYGWSQR